MSDLLVHVLGDLDFLLLELVSWIDVSDRMNVDLDFRVVHVVASVIVWVGIGNNWGSDLMMNVLMDMVDDVMDNFFDYFMDFFNVLDFVMMMLNRDLINLRPCWDAWDVDEPVSIAPVIVEHVVPLNILCVLCLGGAVLDLVKVVSDFLAEGFEAHAVVVKSPMLHAGPLLVVSWPLLDAHLGFPVLHVEAQLAVASSGPSVDVLLETSVALVKSSDSLHSFATGDSVVDSALELPAEGRSRSWSWHRSWSWSAWKDWHRSWNRHDGWLSRSWGWSSWNGWVWSHWHRRDQSLWLNWLRIRWESDSSHASSGESSC